MEYGGDFWGGLLAGLNMPKADIGNLRVLLEKGSDDPEKVFFCPMLGASILCNDENRRTPEHICPNALGGKNWQIAVSRSENEGFSNRFEQKFLLQPWIVFGRQANEIDGRRQGKRIIVDGYERGRVGDRINKLTMLGGRPAVEVVDTQKRKLLLDHAPIEISGNDELCVHRVPTPVPVLLEATKIAFEQLHWHLDTAITNLEVIKRMRVILQIKDVETFRDLRPYISNRLFGYFLCVKYLDPNPIHEDGRYFPMELRFVDYVSRVEGKGARQAKKRSILERLIALKRQGRSDSLAKNWLVEQSIRWPATHSFKLKVCAKSEFEPARLDVASR